MCDHGGYSGEPWDTSACTALTSPVLIQTTSVGNSRSNSTQAQTGDKPLLKNEQAERVPRGAPESYQPGEMVTK